MSVTLGGRNNTGERQMLYLSNVANRRPMLRVAAGARIAYNDQAMTPVTEDETEMLELFTHNKSAREAVDHARRIKILTAVGASAAQSTV